MVGHNTNARFKQTATHLASPGVRFSLLAPYGEGLGVGSCQPTTHTTPLSPWRGVGGEAFTLWRGLGGEASTFRREVGGEAFVNLSA